MKSKAHYKKCMELGIIPVPTVVDDSYVDEEILSKQVCIFFSDRCTKDKDITSTNKFYKIFDEICKEILIIFPTIYFNYWRFIFQTQQIEEGQDIEETEEEDDDDDEDDDEENDDDYIEDKENGEWFQLMDFHQFRPGQVKSNN